MIIYFLDILKSQAVTFVFTFFLYICKSKTQAALKLWSMWDIEAYPNTSSG